MIERVQLSKRNVTADILSGMSRKDLAEKYNLPMSQMKAAIEALGLTGMRAKKVMFEIVSDDEVDDFIPQQLPPQDFIPYFEPAYVEELGQEETHIEEYIH
jgi:hypothetical protein